jgi:hypothetical protein
MSKNDNRIRQTLSIASTSLVEKGTYRYTDRIFIIIIIIIIIIELN